MTWNLPGHWDAVQTVDLTLIPLGCVQGFWVFRELWNFKIKMSFNKASKFIKKYKNNNSVIKNFLYFSFGPPMLLHWGPLMAPKLFSVASGVDPESISTDPPNHFICAFLHSINDDWWVTLDYLIMESLLTSIDFQRLITSTFLSSIESSTQLMVKSVKSRTHSLTILSNKSFSQPVTPWNQPITEPIDPRSFQRSPMGHKLGCLVIIRF